MYLILKIIFYILVKEYDTCNPFELVKDLKINLYYLDLPCKIRGFYNAIKYRDTLIKQIGINRNLSEKTRRAVLAHELGHAILHPEHSTVCFFTKFYIGKTKYEIEANRFGYYLLLKNSYLEEDKEVNFKIDFNSRQAHEVLRSLLNYEMV